MYPKLEILLEENVSDSESCVKATRFLNTMCAFIRHTEYSHVGLVPCFYKLYNIISQMEISDTDKELANVCSMTLAVLARFWTKPKYVPAILETIDTVSKSSSWLKRVSNTEFLQVWLFHNMSTILSDKRYISKVRTIILRLLEDTRVEVRENAAKVLTGMLHCSILTDEQALLVSNSIIFLNYVAQLANKSFNIILASFLLRLVRELLKLTEIRNICRRNSEKWVGQDCTKEKERRIILITAMP